MAAGWSLFVLLVGASVASVLDGSTATPEAGTPHNLSHLVPFDPTWAPVEILRGMAIRFSPQQTLIESANKCEAGLFFPHAFHLQDIMTVGHMHRTFATFFSYLCGVPKRRTVAAVWGESLDSSIHSSATVRQLVYTPMLRMYQQYFLRQRGLRIQVVEAFNSSMCIRVNHLGQRRCILYDVPPHVKGTTGNCGNWFASAAVVATWRAMLASEAGLRFPLHNLLSVPHRTPWLALVYDRPGPRRFENPDSIRRETLSHLCQHMPTASFLVQIHTFLEMDFLAQCHLFNRYDLIILAHGAGASHIVCARPGAMIVEVGWYWYSSFLILAQQLLLRHCFASVGQHLYVPTAYDHFKDPIQPINLSACLHQFVALHAEDHPHRWPRHGRGPRR